VAAHRVRTATAGVATAPAVLRERAAGQYDRADQTADQQ
jgi:hypothetical protein